MTHALSPLDPGFPRSVAAGFFGREGGVSQGIFAGLNCGFGSSDAPEAVAENRARVAATLGTSPDNVLTAFQIHSAKVVRAETPWPRGQAPECDGLVTTVPGLAVGALAADCAPVLFADGDAGVVAAAHAGWKGALGGVLEATVATMEDAGADRARIEAALGPCISQPSYEVGLEFKARFLDNNADYAAFFSPGKTPDKAHFDLPGFVITRLQALGLKAARNLTRCTYRHESAYFSYRRTTHRGEADYGRNLSVVMLRET